MYLIVDIGEVSNDEGQEERGDQMHPLMFIFLLVAVHCDMWHLFHQFRPHRRLCKKANKQTRHYCQRNSLFLILFRLRLDHLIGFGLSHEIHCRWWMRRSQRREGGKGKSTCHPQHPRHTLWASVVALPVPAGVGRSVGLSTSCCNNNFISRAYQLGQEQIDAFIMQTVAGEGGRARQVEKTNSK